VAHSHPRSRGTRAVDRQTSNAHALQALAPVLTQALRQRGLGHVVLLARLVQHWPTIAGPQLAAVTQPESIRARVLFVAVNDAIWLQQVTFYQAQLLENMRRVLGDVPLTKLHFRLALSSPRQPVCSSPEEVLEPSPLTAVEEQQVHESTAGIADPELREAVRRAWERGWQAKR
jgi:predicted nucleic acid-binding Zn ribbon protein